jgi:D-serine deaminase-like pyridoxal phosphate-dependent protein
VGNSDVVTRRHHEIAAAGFAVPTNLATPSLVIDEARVDANIRSMASRMAARDVALRPHFKTPKSIAVARRQILAGAAGLTCATLGEARVLMEAGLEDVFVAYPVPAYGRRRELLRQLSGMGALSVGIDSLQGATALADALDDPSALGVLIEVDSGDRRTGCVPEEVGVLAAHAVQLGLRVVGAFTHGGHGYVPQVAEQAADDEVSALSIARDALMALGISGPVLSAGSTPTAIGSARPPVTEERPGTYVFGDRQQVVNGSQGADELAAVVLATVISSAVDGQFVLDAGGKFLGKDKPDWLAGHGCVVEHPDAVVTRLYDHHAVCEVAEGAARPAVGSTVRLVPNHICPVVNLAGCLEVVRDGAHVETWPAEAAGLAW